MGYDNTPFLLGLLTGDICKVHHAYEHPAAEILHNKTLSRRVC
jgi:hypothetical protein